MRLLIQRITTTTIMPMNTLAYRFSILFISALLLGGCTIFNTTPKDEQNILTSVDFVSAIPVTVKGDENISIKKETEQVAAQYKELPGQGDWVFIMDAMVGQVNGQAIYASEIFKTDLDNALSVIANQVRNRKLTHIQFTEKARGLIHNELMALVRKKIMYAAALRELPPTSGRAIDAYVDQKEQEYIRKFGNGSKTAAEKNYLEKEGRTLEKEMSVFRHNVTVNEFIKKHITSKIHVSKKDIRLFYARNKKMFQKREKIKINLIRSVKPDDILTINKQLKEGISYLEIAKSQLNSFNRDSAGELDGLPSNLDNVLIEIKKLENTIGKYTAPVEDKNATWWAYISEYDFSPEQSLDQVQLWINNRLRQMQYNKYNAEKRNELFEKSKIKEEIPIMRNNLLNIARSRYLPQKLAEIKE